MKVVERYWVLESVCQGDGMEQKGVGKFAVLDDVYPSLQDGKDHLRKCYLGWVGLRYKFVMMKMDVFQLSCTM